jgi:hypothetical protein
VVAAVVMEAAATAAAAVVSFGGYVHSLAADAFARYPQAATRAAVAAATRAEAVRTAVFFAAHAIMRRGLQAAEAAIKLPNGQATLPAPRRSPLLFLDPCHPLVFVRPFDKPASTPSLPPLTHTRSVCRASLRPSPRD